MVRVEFTNGRHVYVRDLDDSDPDYLWGINLRGRRVWLLKRCIRAVV